MVASSKATTDYTSKSITSTRITSYPYNLFNTIQQHYSNPIQERLHILQRDTNTHSSQALLNEKVEYKRGVPRAEVMNFEMKMALAEYCKDCMLYVQH